MSSDRWESLFEDLELQFAAERDAAHSVLETERDRTRVGRLSLRDRLAGLETGAEVVVDDDAGEVHRLRLAAVGADWLAGTLVEYAGVILVRLEALHAVRIPRGVRASTTSDPILERMDVGFVLRGIARRRTRLVLGLVRGGRLAGTPERVGSDHVDVALHDADRAPRATDVHEVRTLAFRAIAWIRVTARGDLGIG